VTNHDNDGAVTGAKRYRGCLLGGAVGDALGAPVEFLSLEEIRARFGPSGVTDYAPAFGRAGAITDDTQMTLFTAEGLIRCRHRAADRGLCTPTLVLHKAYLRWLRTQGEESATYDFGMAQDGWLVDEAGLHARRAPGATCLGALRGAEMGRPDRPLNDSKGCGGVMRVAPVGLSGERDPFSLACDIAALTHGHPSGYLSAGVLASVVDGLRRGDPLGDALDAATTRLREFAGHEETLRALEDARSLAASGPPTPEALQALGGGWTGEEALAIAVACALTASGFEDGVLRAVNHGGDSDSTGSIAGALLGTLHGVDAIPPAWLTGLELRDVIEILARDLAAYFHDRSGRLDYGRYPPH